MTVSRIEEQKQPNVNERTARHPALRKDVLVSANFKIQRQIGQGGFGCVFIVEDVRDQRCHALKVRESNMTLLFTYNMFRLS